MPAARDALKRMGVKITGVLVDALLDTDRDFVIRRRVPRVLVDLPSAAVCRRPVYRSARMPASRCASMLVAPCFCCSKIIRVSQFRPSVPGKQSTGSYPCNAPVWNSHRLLDHRGSQETQWFFDDELLDRADRNLEHLFTLLALAAARRRCPDCLSRAPHRRPPAQRNRFRVSGKRDAAAYASTLVADARSRRRNPFARRYRRSRAGKLVSHHSASQPEFKSRTTRSRDSAISVCNHPVSFDHRHLPTLRRLTAIW